MSRVAVLGGDAGPGHLLALGLKDVGEDVVALGSAFPSGSAVGDALDQAGAALAGLDAVVDARVPAQATRPTPLADLDEEEWAVRAEEPMRMFLHLLQGAHRVLSASGGAVVLLLPTLAFSGAPGLVPWVTAAEGCRALAKVAARTWGRDRIRVNTLGVPADLLVAPDLRPAESGLDRPGLPPPAFDRPPDLRTDVATTVSAMIGAGFSSVTGLTLAVDGGVWMTP